MTLTEKILLSINATLKQQNKEIQEALNEIKKNRSSQCVGCNQTEV